jgi:hypothetical protein
VYAAIDPFEYGFSVVLGVLGGAPDGIGAKNVFTAFRIVDRTSQLSPAVTTTRYNFPTMRFCAQQCRFNLFIWVLFPRHYMSL